MSYIRESPKDALLQIVDKNPKSKKIWDLESCKFN